MLSARLKGEKIEQESVTYIVCFRHSNPAEAWLNSDAVTVINDKAIALPWLLSHDVPGIGAYR
ncbi:hypothetical protein DSLASN_31690 [Desulfoluna limicola]|uniref:Uncharacterized protein n=1 Tax=Desulfoluna limicola TaxID=2810562 RepID=A0ABM7PJ06_9BACT|nr:hypothetical protein DSLASN_31690 [Desulfoluna limicola]